MLYLNFSKNVPPLMLSSNVAIRFDATTMGATYIVGVYFLVFWLRSLFTPHSFFSSGPMAQILGGGGA